MILYELFVGQPPFYTNSIYSLIHHIVKDPVKYPDSISPQFRSFLQARTRPDRRAQSHTSTRRSQVMGSLRAS